MSKVGIIDIGTNTVLCLKAAVYDDDIDIILDSRFHYRAGSRLDEKGNIAEGYKTGMRRALLSAMSTLTDCQEIKIVATEVLRKPKDGAAFAEKLSDEIGCKIDIIDSQREAELSFFGATRGMGLPGERLAVIDIGGGSSELAVGTDEGLERWSGVKMGAVSISEAVGYDMPPANYLEYASKTFAESDLGELLTARPSQVILVGGSAVAIAALLDGQNEFMPERLSGFQVNSDALGKLLENLSSMDLDKRREVMAFDRERADIIVAGGSIILAFMNNFDIPEVKISTRGLRHGLLLELFG
jgi:exopolyphosphatase/guanosine-5'-triphosphate,3'-diphosphate pyrophosphatase